MARVTRRDVLKSAVASSLLLPFAPVWGAAAPKLSLATFEVDITTPLGHPLCGGWIKPAEVIEDRLQGLGVVLLGADKPIVLMVLDWCELNNEGNRLWREAIAKSVGTTSERVAIQCVHPHNAPIADVAVEKLLQEKFHKTMGLDLKFFDEVVKKSAEAAKEALKSAQPVTHVGTGQAKVDQVASNRRIIGPDGKIKHWRGSASKVELHSEPEGLIDPWLKTLSFWNGDLPLAALSYYATHPMSYYGDGRVNPDFAGYARMKRQTEMPKTLQMYFNGCGGNIAPGKYNDGAHANRPVLRDRIYDGMVKAWNATTRHPVTECAWRSVPLNMEVRKDPEFTPEYARQVYEKAEKFEGQIGHAVMKLAWAGRKDRPIDLTCLDLGVAQVVHLPGEPFVEYQLFAQQQRPNSVVCVAGYGDGGPGYIPTEKAYSEGGYETGVAYTGPGSEQILRAAIAEAMKG